MTSPGPCSWRTAIYRLRYLIILIFIFLLSFGLIGLLFDLHRGFIIGSLLAIFLLTLFSFWGEKIVLVFAKARYVTDDEILINKVKNFCGQSELSEVKVYWSNIFVNNVYYTNSYFGNPSLIIGKNIYKKFTRNELNSLIYASVLKLKSNESKHRTIASLIFFILYSPIYFLRFLTKSEQIAKGMTVFLYPAYYLKSKLYEVPKDVFNFDLKVAKLEGLRKDYCAALFKISQLPVCSETSIGGLMMNELNHVKNTTPDVLVSLLISHVEVDERVKKLK